MNNNDEMQMTEEIHQRQRTIAGGIFGRKNHQNQKDKNLIIM